MLHVTSKRKTAKALYAMTFVCTLIVFGCSNNGISTNNKRILLQEDSSSPITNIDHISISPDGKLLSISDARSGIVFVYEKTSGSLVRRLAPASSLSDSAAAKGYYPIPNCVLVSSRDLHTNEGQVMPQDFIRRSLPNSYKLANFINDSEIAIIGQTFAFLKDTTNEQNPFNRRAIFAQITIANVRTGTIYTSSPLDFFGDGSSFAQCYAFLPMHDGVHAIVGTTNDGAVKDNGYDTAWAFALFRTDGKFENTVGTLPVEAAYNNLMYSVLSPAICMDSLGQIWAAYSCLPYVYELSGTKRKIKITGLTASNEKFIRGVRESRRFEARSINWDSLFELKPIFLADLAAGSNGSIAVTIVQRISSHPWRRNWIIQRYDENLKLRGSILLADSNSYAEQRQYVTYDGRDEEIISCSLSKSEHWMIEYSKW